MNNSLIEQFVEDVCAGKTNETAQTYRTKLGQLARFMKSKPITPENLKAFQKDLLTRKTHRRGSKYIEGGLSIFTVKTTLQTTRHFCKWLFENKHIKQDLAKTIRLPQTPPPAPKAIRGDAVTCMVEAALNTGEDWQRARNVAILFFLRDTGCRIGGLVNAQLPGLDLDHGIIETYEKGKNITLYINAPTIQAIRMWLDYRPIFRPLTEHVFISHRTNQGITRLGVQHMLYKLARIAHVDDRSNPHAWRHAFARDFLKNGGEITQLAGIMHHSSIWVTTNYYARWDMRGLKEAHTKNSPINSLEVPS